MTPNLKYINTSILALCNNALPSLNFSELIIQQLSLTWYGHLFDYIPNYQLLDKEKYCKY